MEMETIYTGVAGVIGGGGLYKIIQVAANFWLKKDAQSVQHFEKLADRHEREIKELKSECLCLRDDNEKIRAEHAECMEQHTESQRRLGEMDGRVDELRKLTYAAVGLTEKPTVNFPAIQQPE